MSDQQSILLNVEIPTGIDVGSSITVCYEENYFEIVVPEGGPGNTIQVAIPAPEKVPLVKASIIEDANSTPTENASSSVASLNPSMKNLAIAGTAGVVVGALILGPITVGAVILGGAAVYGAKEHVKNLPVDEHGNKVSDGTMLSKAAIVSAGAAQTVHETNQKYQITATVAATATKVAQKVHQTDQEYKISENASIAAAATAAKVVEVDKKYQISAKASEATAATISKAKDINEKYQITEKASAAAFSLFTRASAAVGKISAPNSAAATEDVTATPVSR